MVQYNKKIISNKNLNLNKSNKLIGGNFFSELHFGWQIVIIGLVIGLIKLFIVNFFRLKLNGVVFPIIFGYLGYQLYTTLTYHMEKIGNALNNRDESKIEYIIINWKKIIYSLPLLVPKIPKIPIPTFNYQPFKGIKKGIQFLRVPISIDGEDYRLSINFPKLEIPFIDPLAGICCVWEQIKKLLKLVEKAIEPPKKLVEKMFGGIKKACLFVKDVLIMRNIKRIVQVVGVVTYPPIGMFMGVIKFFDFIEMMGGDMSGPRGDIQNIIDKLNSFRTGDFIGGNNYANINKNTNKNSKNNRICLNDIFYKINLLNYEDKIDKKADKLISKMSIYKIYKIQNSEKEGLINYVNKHKKKNFKKFLIRKFRKYKIGQSKFNYEKKYNTKETNEMIKKMKEGIDNIKQSTYEGYNLEELKIKYNNVVNNSKKNQYTNLDKYGIQYGIEKGLQYGGDPFSDMIDALNIVNILKKAINKIPRIAYIPCYIYKFIFDKLKIITNAIGDIQKLIFSKIPVFMQKIKDLIVYVNDMAKWFVNVVIKKGIGIYEAAIDFVTKIGEALPGGIGEYIFFPIKIYFQLIIAFLKLPFAEFFFSIVDILTNIPKFFNTVTDAIIKVCNIIGDIMTQVLEALLAPAMAVYRAAKKIYEALTNPFGFGGGGKNLIMYNSGLTKILIKNKNELNLLINTYENLPPDKINDFYMNKLEKLIKEKHIKIQKIKTLLIKYNKKKSKKSKKNLLLIKN